jgi:hypothetical protein
MVVPIGHELEEIEFPRAEAVPALSPISDGSCLCLKTKHLNSSSFAVKICQMMDEFGVLGRGSAFLTAKAPEGSNNCRGSSSGQALPGE